MGITFDSSSSTVSFNAIAFNDCDGVDVLNSSLQNRIRWKSITGNIDLGNDGVTVNAADDRNIGTNNLQNYPLLAYTQPDTGPTETSPDMSNSMEYLLDFYGYAGYAADGSGEGNTHLGSSSFVTAATGKENHVATNISSFAAEEWITVTATLGSGQSSRFEFSDCIPAIPDRLKLQSLTISGGNAQYRACSYITGEMNSRIKAGTNAVLCA